jgi:hypothetical protein
VFVCISTLYLDAYTNTYESTKAKMAYNLGPGEHDPSYHLKIYLKNQASKI